jgi:hypothetical protein
MMIPVTDTSIKISLLLHLIEHLDRGDLTDVLGNETCPRILDRLRQLNSVGLLRLANMNQPKVSVSFDTDSIDIGLDVLMRQDSEIEDLVHFIRNGASLSMLNQLFVSTDPLVINSYRKMLQCTRKSGRSPLPDPETRDAIHIQWHSIQQTQDSFREKLRKIHGAFNTLSMDVIFATINEFQDIDI